MNKDIKTILHIRVYTCSRFTKLGSPKGYKVLLIGMLSILVVIFIQIVRIDYDKNHAKPLNYFETSPTGRTGEELDNDGINPYVCSNFDWWPSNKCDYGNCSWAGSSVIDINLHDTILISAAKQLGGIIRIGGTLQDTITYDLEITSQNCGTYPMRLPVDRHRHDFHTGGCLSATRILQLTEFSRLTKTKYVFGINYLHGRIQDIDGSWSGKWDPSNAMSLLQFIHDNELQDYFYGFELGNEISGRRSIVTAIPYHEYAQDFHQLDLMLQSFDAGKTFSHIKLIGVDSNLDIPWTKSFLSRLGELGTTLDVFTWHEYEMGPGSSNNVDTFVMDHTFGKRMMKKAISYRESGLFTDQVAAVEEKQQLLSSKNTSSMLKPHPSSSSSTINNTRLWMGETGGAYNSGRNTITNRFMSAFWYLDWMAVLSAYGHTGFCRQTLIGGNYGLLQNHPSGATANPDLYAAILYQHLMVGKVFTVHDYSFDSAIHQYGVHSTNTNNIIVTYLFLNYNADELGMNIKYPCDHSGGDGNVENYFKLTRYTVTSDDLQSNHVFINGVKLITIDGVIPDALSFGKEDVYHCREKFNVPGHSYSFIQFHRNKEIHQEIEKHESYTIY
jgi:heparanase 1